MKKIAEGRTADIFEQETGKIVKLYRRYMDVQSIQYEYAVNQVVGAFDLAAPKAYELLEAEQRRGIVFERVEGETMLSLIIRQPGEMNRLAAQFAKLQNRIHRYEVEVEVEAGTGGKRGILKQKELLKRHINSTPLLSEQVKNEILEQLEQLPDGNRLCHGDYHPDNVMFGEQSWVIDWMNGTVGQPAADVARTVLLIRHGALPDDAPSDVIEAIQHMRENIISIYLEHYLQVSGLQQAEIDQWLLPVAAARLAEGQPEQEQKQILGLVDRLLAESRLRARL
ncbi:phosphotransferase family protein [Paenibacillus protaetiae]|uniref:Aminoglycoside phosphotransferase domain-containing protein n=1 Tax=Paenibacillus protaetiae TaxID=2509456 RepID=A0A4P6EYW4_9BACL|nr:phosphotransferase [Paenibacillus protaetiae]QAY68056.1 hypothetical protein ET464_18475 [Paenibacillus protaetiae]